MDVLTDLRRARDRSGLTQRELAQAVGSTQPSIARLEAGRVDPRLGTVGELASRLGLRLALRPLEGLDDVAVAIADDISRGDAEGAFRWVLQLLDDLHRLDEEMLEAHLRLEPPSTGDRRWDAMLAAAAEHVALQRGVPPPGWSAAPSRFLDQWWFVILDLIGRVPKGFAVLALTSPPAFSVRGVMLDPASLVNV